MVSLFYQHVSWWSMCHGLCEKKTNSCKFNKNNFCHLFILLTQIETCINLLLSVNTSHWCNKNNIHKLSIIILFCSLKKSIAHHSSFKVHETISFQNRNSPRDLIRLSRERPSGAQRRRITDSVRSVNSRKIRNTRRLSH